MTVTRCTWCGTDPLYLAYHDTEWGVPEHDGRALWEKLVLDGFQAGLSWITILRKREAFREAFAGFDPEIVAGWGERDVARLLSDPGIVRHRGKIENAVRSARAFLAVEAATGFADWLWSYVGNEAVQTAPATAADVPTATDLSRRLSRDLKAAGFGFCGPTITHAFLEATGLVNDHLRDCHRRPVVAGMRRHAPGSIPHHRMA